MSFQDVISFIFFFFLIITQNSMWDNEFPRTSHFFPHTSKSLCSFEVNKINSLRYRRKWNYCQANLIFFAGTYKEHFCNLNTLFLPSWSALEYFNARKPFRVADGNQPYILIMHFKIWGRRLRYLHETGGKIKIEKDRWINSSHRFASIVCCWIVWSLFFFSSSAFIEFGIDNNDCGEDVPDR